MSGTIIDRSMASKITSIRSIMISFSTHLPSRKTKCLRKYSQKYQNNHEPHKQSQHSQGRRRSDLRHHRYPAGAHNGGNRRIPGAGRQTPARHGISHIPIGDPYPQSAFLGLLSCDPRTRGPMAEARLHKRDTSRCAGRLCALPRHRPSGVLSRDRKSLHATERNRGNEHEQRPQLQIDPETENEYRCVRHRFRIA